MTIVAPLASLGKSNVAPEKVSVKKNTPNEIVH